MSQLMKQRQQNSQRMNGLNDPDKPTKTANAKTINCNSWPTKSTGIPMSFPSQPSPMTLQHALPHSRRPSEKEVSMKSLLEQSSLHQSRQQQKAKLASERIPNWNIPIATYQAMQPEQASNYQTIDFDSPKASDNVLPPGAYYDAPIYVDEMGNPVVFESEQPAAEMSFKPEQPLTSSITSPQQSRCSDANCAGCSSSVQAK